MGPYYKFSQHKKCEFFPCHTVKNEDTFNCLFCYCPLYTLGSKCGGNFVYNEANIKDCSKCLLPHSEKGYDHIMSKWEEISQLATNNK